MMNLIRARVPSIVLFGTLQTAIWTFVWSQWRQPSDIQTPLQSAIPKGYIGKARFAHALSHAAPAGAA